MNDRMALSLLAEVMGWPEDDQAVATREYAWLRMMSAVKYDGYSYFRAGVRFLESLATWLKQFDPADRAAAYDFVKKRLVYISLSEMQCLVETFVPEVVTPHLRRTVAHQLGIKPYEVWTDKSGADAFTRCLRKTLFVGMSDGSRIDMLRRANAGRISTEQVVPMMNVDKEKWLDLSKNLRQAHGMTPTEQFDCVYLIDDFTASGTTFIRKNADGEWKGKLKKFNDLIRDARDSVGDGFPIAENYELHIHHYISSAQARSALMKRLEIAKAEWSEWTCSDYTVTEGLLLPDTLPLARPSDGAMLDLGDKYYDHEIFTRAEKHCREAGQSDMKLGYADCALPIILEHNTPNNSVPLLWAETAGNGGARAMRPLFYRRDRHGSLQ
ncbi:phosphoribosyltransferase-like protein [Bradyrhizobium paxllaeri]|uniref:phosphoribosyltransferase-like protein n=1 Tax=Bradyrhizobium paxllaeri TaxID=190148 RepID=UPI001FE68DDC|nr:hypothetical protein [Bradyrhizobium paxllaeri]